MVTWSNCAVPSKQMKSSSSKAEMLNDVKNLHRFFYVADFRLFCDDEVNVNVRMDEVTICAATHRSFNAHEAVLLRTHNTGENPSKPRRLLHHRPPWFGHVERNRNCRQSKFYSCKAGTRNENTKSRSYQKRLLVAEGNLSCLAWRATLQSGKTHKENEIRYLDNFKYAKLVL